MANWFCNNEPVEHVSISDRAFQYGDGLFETIAIREHKPRLWEYHVQRLAKGCARLRISMPDEDDLLQNLHDALRQGRAATAYCMAKIIVSSGAGLRGYGRNVAAEPAVFFGVFEATREPPEFYRDGVNIVLCKTHLATKSVTAGLKTLNRLEQVLARSELTDSGAFEGLTLDADGNVICGTMSNVFFVANNKIITPSLDDCGVEGVMRRHIMTTLSEHELAVDIGTLHSTDLQDVDEVFVANSQFGVMPVKSCGDLKWPVGGVTQKVMSILADNGVVECGL